jgi:hypothetical protein
VVVTVASAATSSSPAATGPVVQDPVGQLEQVALVDVGQLEQGRAGEVGGVGVLQPDREVVEDQARWASRR